MDRKSAKFAKITSREKFMPHGKMSWFRPRKVTLFRDDGRIDIAHSKWKNYSSCSVPIQVKSEIWVTGSKFERTRVKYSFRLEPVSNQNNFNLNLVSLLVIYGKQQLFHFSVVCYGGCFAHGRLAEGAVLLRRVKTTKVKYHAFLRAVQLSLYI